MNYLEFYKDKKVIIAGGTGMIGALMTRRLKELRAKVTVVSIDHADRVNSVLDDPEIFRWGDLRNFDTCLEVTAGQDCVINLMAIKGNTQIGLSKVASAYVPFILCNTNLMEASFRNRVPRFLFVGSICEYPALEIRHEDDVWNGPPQANDRFTGIAKRAGEAQAETYLHEFGWDAVRIVRPSNVYGPFDDFDPRTAQVIPALISRMAGGENPMIIAGDGTAERDFIYAEDVVEGMLIALYKAPPCFPINLGQGKGIPIKTIAEKIAERMPVVPSLKWDTTKPVGDKVRILCMDRSKETLGFMPETTIDEGLDKTIAWFMENRQIAVRRGKELHG